MRSKRVLWAVNLLDGTPLIVKGVIADVDEKTQQVTIGKRAVEILEEVLAQEPRPTEVFVVPGIDLAHEVHQLVQAKHAAGVPVREPLPQSLRGENSTPPQAPATGSEEIVDQALLRLHRQSAHFGQFLGGHPATVSIAELRRSPIGHDLLFLSRIAHGEDHADTEKVFRIVNTVLDLLFGSASTQPYQVPRAFWEEPLGRMLSQAKLRTINADDLVSIGQATQRLGVTRPTIYRWMDDGTLDYVYDIASGRVYVRRQDVEQLQGSQMLQPPVGMTQKESELARTD